MAEGVPTPYRGMGCTVPNQALGSEYAIAWSLEGTRRLMTRPPQGGPSYMKPPFKRGLLGRLHLAGLRRV